MSSEQSQEQKTSVIGRWAQEWKEELTRGQQRVRNWFRLLGGYKPAIGATPSEVVMRRNKMAVRRYFPTTPDQGNDREHGAEHPSSLSRCPVLLVPSVINRSYILDLQPGKSVVEYLVNAGLDVYLIDWGKPGAEDQYLSFDDYIDHLLRGAIQRIFRLTGTQQIHLVGHCLGGMLTLTYAALYPEEVKSLLNMTTPVDLRHGGILQTWTKPMDPDLMVDALGNAPWPLLQASFHMLKPMLQIQKVAWLYERLWDDNTIDSFISLETWSNDNVSISGEFFRTYIKEIYQRNALYNGSLVVNGRQVDIGTIQQPVLNIAAQGDHIAPEASVLGLVDRVPHTENMVLPGGHIGAVISSRASRTLWPQLVSFLRQHSSQTNHEHTAQ